MARTGVLSADRLELRPFDDALLTERYVAWLNDEVTVRYSQQRYRTHTITSCREFARGFEGSPHFFWGIVARDVGLGHIGNMTATVDPLNRVADLAILIGEPAARGRGYGREAWQRACLFLLNEAGMRKVTAGTMALNEPMLRIMRACSMREEGRRVRQLLFEGQEVDVVLTGLCADALPASQRAGKGEP
jgi:ribosomal-protein-alanine N-acetyltransferase